MTLARQIAAGPAFSNAMTKKMLEDEASLSLEEAIEAEAQAQAICMAHPDFEKPMMRGLRVGNHNSRTSAE